MRKNGSLKTGAREGLSQTLSVSDHFSEWLGVSILMSDSWGGGDLVKNAITSDLRSNEFFAWGFLKKG